jgi:hypothetical protein
MLASLWVKSLKKLAQYAAQTTQTGAKTLEK